MVTGAQIWIPSVRACVPRVERWLDIPHAPGALTFGPTACAPLQASPCAMGHVSTKHPALSIAAAASGGALSLVLAKGASVNPATQVHPGALTPSISILY
jgi:hypothetical protein